MMTDYLGYMEDFEMQLAAVKDDDENPGIVRAAAHATLAIMGKYYANSEDCWILRLTIGK
jgi:hypothetical protein